MKRRGCISVGGKIEKREVVDWGESTLSDAVTVCTSIVMLTCPGRVWIAGDWRTEHEDSRWLQSICVSTLSCNYEKTRDDPNYLVKVQL